MESNDREQIVRQMESNADLRRLYEEHQALEARLAELESRTFITADEEVEEKRLKVKKLQGVDRMMCIISSGAMAHSREPQLGMI